MWGYLYGGSYNKYYGYMYTGNQSGNVRPGSAAAVPSSRPTAG